MNYPDHKTPSRKPDSDGPSKGVFGYDVSRRAFWREMSQASILMFAAVLAAAVVLISLLTGWINDWRTHVKASRDTVEVPVVTETAPEPVPVRRRAIDGVAIPESTPTSGRYYAVMIDNLPVARPQSGLSAASVVYEAPVEGGVTRFMAVFADDATFEKVGPVRSARPYYLDWAAEYDAMYTHVGGSPEALDKIKAIGTPDLNEFFNGPYFWRARDRSAPHNVYTSSELLAEAFDKKFSKSEAEPLDPWKFKDDAPEEDRPDAQKIVIDYGFNTVNVTWTYDPKTNSYLRGQGGTSSVKDGTAPIAAKNVFIQEAKVAILDNVGRRRIDTITEGDATAFIDGLAFHGTWKKDSRDGRTRFYDGAGNEIELNAGQTWVQVVPTGTEVTEQ